MSTPFYIYNCIFLLNSIKKTALNNVVVIFTEYDTNDLLVSVESKSVTIAADTPTNYSKDKVVGDGNKVKVIMVQNSLLYKTDTYSYCCVHSRFTDIKNLCCFAYCCVVFDYVLCQLDRPFFYIILHSSTDLSVQHIYENILLFMQSPFCVQKYMVRGCLIQ